MNNSSAALKGVNDIKVSPPPRLQRGGGKKTEYY